MLAPGQSAERYGDPIVGDDARDLKERLPSALTNVVKKLNRIVAE